MANKIILDSLIGNIMSAKNGWAFDWKYIEHIRFPFYKNLEANARIDFSCPFTVFTWPNWSWKSSVLHAISWAPNNQSVWNFWFSTKIDPIEDSEWNRPCFIYWYKSWSSILEIIKTRINKISNPDYWEPSRPILKYGMKKVWNGWRNPAIDMNVIYLDFRSELSAFDKYFYFQKLKQTKRVKTKQDFVRLNTKYLQKIIEHNEIITLYNEQKNNFPITLTSWELNTIQKILGKTYDSCKIIEHSLFKNEWHTVFFQTTSRNYTEAFAGRGEFAVVKLVHEIYNAPERTLIVLDEPEVSLHPWAQEQLKLFLLEQILEKKLQVVISTHSPKMIEGLPANAVKLFHKNSSWKFQIKNECHINEAFFVIWEEPRDKKIIFVEDSLVEILIRKILKKLGTAYETTFEVRYIPWWASGILKNAVQYSEESEMSKFILLDWDQKRSPIPKLMDLTVKDSEDIKVLEWIIKEWIWIECSKLNFKVDGNPKTGGDIEQKKQAIKRYMDFLYTNLDFLPWMKPEELIWDGEFAKKHSAAEFNDDYKSNFNIFLRTEFPESWDNLSMVYELFINNFLKKEDKNYTIIVNILERFFRSTTT